MTSRDTPARKSAEAFRGTQERAVSKAATTNRKPQPQQIMERSNPGENKTVPTNVRDARIARPTRASRAKTIPLRRSADKTISSPAGSRSSSNNDSPSRTNSSKMKNNRSPLQVDSPRRTVSPKASPVNLSPSPSPSPSPSLSPSRTAKQTGRLIMTSCKPDFLRKHNSSESGNPHSSGSSQTSTTSTSGTTRSAGGHQRVSFLHSLQSRRSYTDVLDSEPCPGNVTLISQTVSEEKPASLREVEEGSLEPQQFVRLHNPLRRTLPSSRKIRPKPPIIITSVRRRASMMNSPQGIDVDNQTESSSSGYMPGDDTGNWSDEEEGVSRFRRSQSLRVSDLIQRFDPGKYRSRPVETSGDSLEQRGKDSTASQNRTRSGNDTDSVTYIDGENSKKSYNNNDKARTCLQGENNKSSTTVTHDTSSYDNNGNSKNNNKNINDNNNDDDEDDDDNNRSNINNNINIPMCSLNDSPSESSMGNSSKVVITAQEKKVINATEQVLGNMDNYEECSTDSVSSKRRIFESAIEKHAQDIPVSKIRNNKSRKDEAIESATRDKKSKLEKSYQNRNTDNDSVPDGSADSEAITSEAGIQFQATMTSFADSGIATTMSTIPEQKPNINSNPLVIKQQSGQPSGHSSMTSDVTNKLKQLDSLPKSEDVSKYQHINDSITVNADKTLIPLSNAEKDHSKTESRNVHGNPEISLLVPENLTSSNKNNFDDCPEAVASHGIVCTPEEKGKYEMKNLNVKSLNCEGNTEDSLHPDYCRDADGKKLSIFNASCDSVPHGCPNFPLHSEPSNGKAHSVAPSEMKSSEESDFLQIHFKMSSDTSQKSVQVDTNRPDPSVAMTTGKDSAPEALEKISKDDVATSDRIHNSLTKLKMELKELRVQDVSLLKQLIAISEAIQRVQRYRALRISKSLSFSSSGLHPLRQQQQHQYPHHHHHHHHHHQQQHLFPVSPEIVRHNLNGNNGTSAGSGRFCAREHREQYRSCREFSSHHQLSVFSNTSNSSGCFSNGDSSDNNNCVGSPNVFYDTQMLKGSLGSLAVLQRQVSSPSSVEARRRDWLAGGSFLSSTDSSVSSFDFTSELPSPNELEESSGSLHSLFASAPAISQIQPRSHSSSTVGGINGLLRMPELSAQSDVTDTDSQSYEEILWRNVRLWKKHRDHNNLLADQVTCLH